MTQSNLLTRLLPQGSRRRQALGPTFKAVRFGPGTKYYRDIVRPRILQSSSVEGTNDPTAEIHILTSRRDWLNMMWTLKSFYRFSPKRYALCIHGDASLDDVTLDTLRAHFPDARIVEYAQATPEVMTWLDGFPRSMALRSKNPLAMKLFDFRYYLKGDRMALFDSDLLFFNEPDAWLDCVENQHFTANTFNRDMLDGFRLDAHVLAALGLEEQPEVNSGFGLVHKESIRRDWIEEFLSAPGIDGVNPWFIEQILYTLCSERFGVTMLPEAYRVYVETGLGKRPMRHYIGPVRHLMYSQGMRKLQKHLL